MVVLDVSKWAVDVAHLVSDFGCVALLVGSLGLKRLSMIESVTWEDAHFFVFFGLHDNF